MKLWKTAGSGEAAGLLQLHFTLEEVAALYLGRQLLEPLAGTYFAQGAQSALVKIRAILQISESGDYFNTSYDRAHKLG